MIRPELREVAWRWREVLAGTAMALIGGWLAMIGIGLVAGLGIVLVVGGISLIAAGWQRGRFRIGRGGAGVVSLVEGQITYFGPISGGAIAIADIDEVVLNPLPRAGPVWELRAAGADTLRIPVGASGSDVMFDALTSLSGLGAEVVLAALADPGRVPRTIWARRHTARVH